MAYEFHHTRRVQFDDTDMAGIVHFAAYFRYMEEAEHVFYRALDFPLHEKGFRRGVGVPRVHARCDFLAPLRFEDMVRIHLVVRDKKRVSLHYDFSFFRQDDVPVATGNLSVVFATLGDPMRAVEIPAELAAAIEIAPAD